LVGWGRIAYALNVQYKAGGQAFRLSRGFDLSGRMNPPPTLKAMVYAKSFEF